MSAIPVHHFLILGALLFGVGVLGVILRRNALIVLMSIELMLNAANLTLLAFARAHNDSRGHAFAFFGRNSTDQFTLGGLSRRDRHRTRFQMGQGRLSIRQSQAPFVGAGAMAGDAILGEYGLHIA